ncbi:MAG: CBS domain-containing protein [Anaerolineales bacterium]|nr:CBS domain-containing protein [Anaerolineales bacterium]
MEETLQQRRVSDLMTTEVITVGPETRVGEVARLMSQHDVSGLPVVDADHRVIGVVTELDLIVRNAHFKLPSFLFIFDNMIPLELPGHYRERLERAMGTSAREIMSEPPVTISPDTTIEALADLMVDRRINPVPVVAQGRLVGIVSRSDIIRHMAEDLSEGNTTD